MLNIASPAVPDFDRYAELIGAVGTKVYIDYNRYVTKLNYFYAMYETAEYNCSQWIHLITLGTHKTISRDALLSALIDYCGLSDSKFRVYSAKQKEKVLSIDQTKVILPLKEWLDSQSDRAGEGIQLATHLVDCYLEYKHLKSLQENVGAKLKYMSEESYAGWSGPLKTIGFCYEKQSTGRYYTSNDNLQNWNLQIVNSICAPKDHFLFWCDFAQVDFRVGYEIYLKEPGSDDDIIYRSDDDRYRAMYTIMCKGIGITPDYDLFATTRKRYKKAVLSAMYNAFESTLAKDMRNPLLASHLKTFFNINPRYQAYRKILDRVIDFGIEVPIKDYFGFTRVLPVPDTLSQDTLGISSKSAYKDRLDLTNKGCNTPVQAASNSVLVIWIVLLMEEMGKQGFGDLITPYLIRHDEAIFCCHIDFLKEVWRLGDFMQIAVDDWGLLELEPHLGLNYSEPLDYLEQIYTNGIEEHKNQFTPRTVFEPRRMAYRPLADVVSMYTFTMHTPIEFVGILRGYQEPELTADDAVAVIAEIANTPSHMNVDLAQKWLRFGSVWVVKSNKLNKYKCVSDVGYGINILKAIDGQFLHIDNCTKAGRTVFDGIFVKLESKFSFDVNIKLEKLEALGFPTEWVSLEG